MPNETISASWHTETNGNASPKCKEEFHHPQVVLLPQDNHLLSLMTILRDADTTASRFAQVVERVAEQLVGAGVHFLSWDKG